MPNLTAMPSIGNITFTHYINYVNAATNNTMGTMALVTIWAVMFLGMKLYSTERAFLASTFLTTIIAWLFFAVGILDQWWAVAMTVLLLVSIALMLTLGRQ